MGKKRINMFSSKGSLLLLFCQNMLSVVQGSSSRSRNSGKADTGPPPFFLQDSTDGMCLSGEGFKRCAIDTLFYVVGSPGSYQIHKRPIGDDDSNKRKSDGDSVEISSTSNSADICISKKSCSPSDVKKVLPAKLTKCSHCGAKSWNILGDASTGYILSENDGETCLFRATQNRAVTAPCDTTELTYTPLQLQFATASDISIMKSPGAQLITAAADGDVKLVEKLLRPPDDGEGDIKGVDVNSRDWDDLTALTPAAANDHFDVVKLLIENGADVNLSDKDGITPLMEASINGRTDIVELLLTEGATADAKASSGVTALWLAAGEGKLDVVSLLLSKGQADPSNVRSDGITALMTASANGHASTVKVLLEEGADALTTDQEGLTPLMNAAESGNVEAMRLIVESIPSAADDGSEISPRQRYLDQLSDTGFTALIVAAAHGNTDAIKYLLTPTDGAPGASIDFFHETGVTALMYAAAGNHTESTTALLKQGADVNIQHSNGGSALLEASTAGATGALKALMDHGAKVDIIDDDGVTPIMSAASQGHMGCLTMLVDSLQSNADVDFNQYLNLLSHSGGSAIMFAAGGGHVNATTYLMEKGAEIDAIARATPEYLVALQKALDDGTATEEQKEPHVDGVTALHVAAEGGHLDCVKLLLEHNAANNVKDDQERTALTMAIKGNYGKVASELVRHGADPNTKYVDEDGVSHDLLMDALIVENVEFATLLVKNGADLYYVDSHNVSTLLQAAHRGLDTVVKELLEKNAMDLKDSDKNTDAAKNYLNLPSDEGITPLIAAASEVYPEVVSHLIAAGVEVNAVDKDGTSALMAAAARGNIEAVEQLLQAKADVNMHNVDGHTALMFAYNGKNQVETLWERYHQFVDEAKVTTTTTQTTSGGIEESDKDSGDVVSTKDTKVEDGGSGSLIKDALEKHTKLVQVLLEHGADETSKDKEGHTAKDFDFHPEMDSDVLRQEEIAERRRDNSRNEL